MAQGLTAETRFEVLDSTGSVPGDISAGSWCLRRVPYAYEETHLSELFGTTLLRKL
jgi:hypothetical protein